jgi:peptidyl-prolyl cis-trans isomerase B (cyclophilin B)
MRKIMMVMMSVLLMFLVACAEEEAPKDDNVVENENWMTRPQVTITVRNYGEMTLTLYPNIAPITVNNFLNYVVDGEYDLSGFHRIIEGFMIQGGIVDETICPIYGEFMTNGFDNPLLHTRGVLSMARTAEVNSQTSQFFIMHEDEPFLDGKYTSFGKLTSGYDVLDAIAQANTDVSDRPLQPIVIESIVVDLDGFEVGEVDCYE